MSAPTKEKVITEGAEIYCERRGNGPLMLLITGAMEDAGFYSSAADILAEKLQLFLMIGDVTLAALEIEMLT
jgi:hypothetical protein